MTKTTQKIVEILQASSLDAMVKQDLLNSLNKFGANPTTFAFVRKAMENHRDQLLKQVGIEIEQDEQYVKAFGEFLAKNAQAEVEFQAEMKKLVAQAEGFKKDLQPGLDAMKAQQMKEKIEEN